MKIANYLGCRELWIATILKNQFGDYFKNTEYCIGDVDYPDEHFITKAHYYTEYAGRNNDEYTCTPKPIRDHIISNFHEYKDFKTKLAFEVYSIFDNIIANMNGRQIPIETLQVTEKLYGLCPEKHYRGIKMVKIDRHEMMASALKVDNVCCHIDGERVVGMSEVKYGTFVSEDVMYIGVSTYRNFILPESTEKLFGYLEELKLVL